MMRRVGASVCGASHERFGQECQDAHACSLLPNDLLLIAVADGAGSAGLAATGSALAIGRVQELLTRYAEFPGWESEEEWRTLFTEVFTQTLESLRAEAEARRVPIRELATTLIVAVVGREGAATAHIGDGAVVLRDPNGDLHTLTAPQTGEYINETRFLTALEDPEEIEIALYCGRVTHIAAFSDGLQSVALRQPDNVPHPPFFTPLFQFVAHIEEEASANAQLTQFLTSERIRQRADDDLTLVLGCFV